MSKNKFSLPVNVEARYIAHLDKIANNCKMILESYTNPDEAAAALTDYARIIEKWAKLVAHEMITDVERNRNRAWDNMTPKRPSQNELMIRARKEKRNGITASR